MPVWYTCPRHPFGMMVMPQLTETAPVCEQCGQLMELDLAGTVGDHLPAASGRLRRARRERVSGERERLRDRYDPSADQRRIGEGKYHPVRLSAERKAFLNRMPEWRLNKLPYNSDDHLFVWGFRQQRPDEEHRFADDKTLESRRYWEEQAARRGHQMTWTLNERAFAFVEHGRRYYRRRLEGRCENCGATAEVACGSASPGMSARYAARDECRGPGTAWMDDLEYERQLNLFGQAITQFGQEIKDIHDRDWLRQQGLLNDETTGHDEERLLNAAADPAAELRAAIDDIAREEGRTAEFEERDGDQWRAILTGTTGIRSVIYDSRTGWLTEDSDEPGSIRGVCPYCDQRLVKTSNAVLPVVHENTGKTICTPAPGAFASQQSSDITGIPTGELAGDSKYRAALTAVEIFTKIYLALADKIDELEASLTAYEFDRDSRIMQLLQQLKDLYAQCGATMMALREALEKHASGAEYHEHPGDADETGLR